MCELDQHGSDFSARQARIDQDPHHGANRKAGVTGVTGTVFQSVSAPLHLGCGAQPLVPVRDAPHGTATVALVSNVILDYGLAFFNSRLFEKY